jgi:hypothetical protein
MNKIHFVLLLALVAFTGVGCRKTDFATIDSPAYLRVFNCLDYSITLDNKDAPQPFLTMLINPVLDADGIPQSAETTGDFLDIRDAWARPYPDAGNTSVYQKEYPGSAKVLAAPILNGYDLSSWAQVPSGSRRVMFFSRPLSKVPFFSLEKNQRRQLLIDTTITLAPGQVYTMHVLQQDFITQKNMLYLRHETFVDKSFSDSLVYVNFYNLSSNGFAQYSPDIASGGVELRNKIEDVMNVFCTLRKSVSANESVPVAGFSGLPMGTVSRSLLPTVTPYYSFPLFADTSAGKVFTGNVSQIFTYLKPGLNPDNFGYPGFLAPGAYLGLGVGPFGFSNYDIRASVMADIRSGLIVSERSGIYNPRSFATVNSIEYINRRVYVTTVQRKFEPPIY